MEVGSGLAFQPFLRFFRQFCRLDSFCGGSLQLWAVYDGCFDLKRYSCLWYRLGRVLIDSCLEDVTI